MLVHLSSVSLSFGDTQLGSNRSRNGKRQERQIASRRQCGFGRDTTFERRSDILSASRENVALTLMGTHIKER